MACFVRSLKSVCAVQSLKNANKNERSDKQIEKKRGGQNKTKYLNSFHLKRLAFDSGAALAAVAVAGLASVAVAVACGCMRVV